MDIDGLANFDDGWGTAISMKECSVLLEPASLPICRRPPHDPDIQDWKEVLISQVKSRPPLYTPRVHETVRDPLWEEVTEALINAGHNLLPDTVGTEQTG